MKIVIEMKIKEYRKEKRISVRRLAELIGISKTYISDVENNHKIPTLYTLCLNSVQFGVSPKALFTYKVIK